MLEDDPFSQIDDGTIPPQQQQVRVVVTQIEGNPFQPFFRGLFDVPSQRISHHSGSLFHFSKKEVNDLALATLAFSLAIAFVRLGGIFTMLQTPLGPLLLVLVQFTLFSMFALAPAFILHELAHKVVARKYGCWAEFRADPRGLKIGLAIAALLGFVFMAPGAVMVAGRVSRSQNGRIAIAGPLTNIALFFIGFVAATVLLPVFPNPLLVSFVTFWMWGNAILAAFNMLPFGPLDGAKVKSWSEPLFWSTLIVTVFLVYSVMTGIAF